jgi:short-subunit dehydrogenase
MKQLRGKTALVTGASRGIGPHIVRALAEEGMHFVLSARSVAALESTAEQARALGARVSCVAADLSRRSDLEALAQRAAREPGGVALLVNNAAIECALPFEQVDVDMIEEMIAVDLTAPMVLTRLLLPHMIQRGEGHVVNMSSLAGLVGTPYEEAYAAAKHGLVGFSRSLHLTLRSDGHPVGVSVICPAFVEEAGMYHSASLASRSKAPLAIGTVPMRKIGRAVVRAIVRNEPEVVLTGMPMLPFLLTQSVSPRLAARMSALVGVPAMFRKWADASLGATSAGAGGG